MVLLLTLLEKRSEIILKKLTESKERTQNLKQTEIIPDMKGTILS